MENCNFGKRFYHVGRYNKPKFTLTSFVMAHDKFTL